MRVSCPLNITCVYFKGDIYPLDPMPTPIVLDLAWRLLFTLIFIILCF